MSHRFARRLAGTALLALASLACAAAPPREREPVREGAATIFRDWAVACDNTGHCEAIGYTSDSDSSAPAALRLARDAGPATPVEARLEVEADETSDGSQPQRVQAGAVTVTVQPGEDLAAADVARLLPALLAAKTAAVADDDETRTLSLDGLAAALLKIDEAQGRLGTPGALVRRGTRAESTVPPARAATRPISAPRPAARPGDDRLAERLRPHLPGLAESCTDTAGDASNAQVVRLAARQVLVIWLCDSGPYQADYMAWLAADAPPWTARAVDFPRPDGRHDALLWNVEFEGDTLTSTSRGRAGGDCGDFTRWAWTGRDFALVEADQRPLCRGLHSDLAIRTWTSGP
jgi:hypothetical protein